MKLKSIKLLSPFRSLPEGFELHFDTEQGYPEPSSPICFVGRNGSGKSNVMELLCEIFYELELFNLSENKEYNLKLLSNINNIKYEVEYEKEINYSQRIIKFTKKEIYPFITIIEKDYDPMSMNQIIAFDNEISKYVYISQNPETKQESSSMNVIGLKYLTEHFGHSSPQRIIGYSSGHNELISNPFLKMRFHYYQNYINQIQNNIFERVEMGKLLLMDNSTNEIALLCNYLFTKENPSHEVLKTHTKVKNIDSFRIVIERGHIVSPLEEFERFDEDERTVYYLDSPENVEMKKGLSLLRPFESDIENLIKCATIHYSTESKEQIKLTSLEEFRYTTTRLVLDFKVTEASKQAFEHYFGNVENLYNILSQLSLLNIYTYTDEQINTVRQADIDFNLATFLPRRGEDELVFNISNVNIRRDADDMIIPYKGLSDGEHQFMHVMGTISLMSDENTLFLLDEPETHLNPWLKWKYIETLKAINRNKEHNQILINTHEPLLVGGLDAKNVRIFQRNFEGALSVNIPQENPKGLGVAGILTSEIFGLPTTLDLDTQELLYERNLLYYKQQTEGLSEIEKNQMSKLFEELNSLGFASTFSDPLYQQFIVALGKKKGLNLRSNNPEERARLDAIASDILDELLAESQS